MFRYSIEKSITTTKLLPFLGVLLAVCLFGAPLHAQGWEKVFGGPATDEGTSVIQTLDRGFLSIGYSESFGEDNDIDVYAVKTDLDGKVVWSKVYDLGYIEHGYKVLEAADGGFVIAGDIIPKFGEASDLLLLKISKTGDLLWHRAYNIPGNQVAWSVSRAINDGYVLAGESRDTLNGDRDAVLLRVDEQGEVLWMQTFGGAKDDIARAVCTTADGYVVAGAFEAAIGFDNNVFVRSVDTLGNLRWADTLATPEREEANAIITTADGGAVLAGLTGNNSDALVMKYSRSGERLWTTTVGEPGLSEYANAIIELRNGELVLVGAGDRDAVNIDILLAGLDPTGKELWRNWRGDDINTDEGKDIAATYDGGFIITGYNSLLLQFFNDLTLIKTDGGGNTITNKIRGKILGRQCNTGQSLPIPKTGWLIEAKSDDKTYLGTTDEEGNFDITVDKGKYLVTLLPLNTYWKTCNPGGYLIDFEAYYETVTIDFSVQAEKACPYLQVDVSAPFNTLCSDLEYRINYCNLGTENAPGAYIEVTLDELLVFESSSIPVSAIDGRTYIFDLGNVRVGNCGSFTIQTSTPCEGIYTGRATLVKAHIFPDRLCEDPDPNWDGSSVFVTGACDQDSVSFAIKNVGTGAMASPRKFFIVEDDVVVFLQGTQQTFQLSPQQIFELPQKFPADGKTYRIIAEQSAGHPGRSNPTLAIEGCLPEGGGTVSTGFFTQFPEDDGNPSVSVDVSEIIGSFEGIFLRGYPKGYGEARNIAPDTKIKYDVLLQHSFGTDTIRRLVIKDTLPESLDVSTLVMGAGSHPYKYEITGESVLTIIFERLELQAGEHLFVAFEIAPKANVPLGTYIENSATVYFDVLAPFQTNSVGHTLGTLDDFSVAVEHPHVAPGFEVRVFPNPFHASALFEIKSDRILGKVNFLLLDPTGRVLRMESFYGNYFDLYRKDLSAGMYYFQLITDGQIINSGKLVIR